MIKDVYVEIPVLETDCFLLREIDMEADAEDLLKVYSDERSLPLFNSDNCWGNFHCTTLQQVQGMISAWQGEYTQKYYVRWAVVDKRCGKAIGTIELFNRKAGDYFTDCGLLRLDLRSDYENEESIRDILSLIVAYTKELFHCDWMATKAVPLAEERIRVLKSMGFTLSKEVINGKNGVTYGDYYEKEI